MSGAASSISFPEHNKEVDYREGKLCISRAAVLNAGIPDDTVKWGTTKGSWQSIEDAKDGRRIWIIYDSIPEASRARIDAHYGNIQAWYWRNELMRQAQMLMDTDDLDYFKNPISHRRSEVYLTISQAQDLYRLCGYLRLAQAAYKTHGGIWRNRGKKAVADKLAGYKIPVPVVGSKAQKDEVVSWYEGSTAVKEDYMRLMAWVLSCIKDGHGKGGRLYGASAIRQWRGLDIKVQDWMRTGRLSLLPEYYGNDNSKKLGDNAAAREKAILRLKELYAHPDKYSFPIVQEIYLREAKANGWPEWSLSRIKSLLTAPDMNASIIPTRHGVNAARGVRETSFRRRAAAYADELWSVDGTTVQLYATDKKGKTLVKPWYVVIVVDMYSRAIVGWAAGATETKEVVQRALKHAVRRGGHAGRVIQYDRGAANMSAEVQDWIGRTGRLGLACQPYNGKAKPVENVIAQLEQGVLRHFANFVGGNITTKRLDSKANPDYLKQQLADGIIPTEEQVLSQLALGIEVYNNEFNKGWAATRIESYMTNVHDLRKPLSPVDVAALLWTHRKERVPYTKDGISFVVEKKKLFFEVESERGVNHYEWEKHHLGDRFTVKYDIEDLSQIHLYDDKDRWVVTANRKYEFSPVPKDRPEGEQAMIMKRLENRSRAISEALADAAAVRKHNREAGLEEPGFGLVHKDSMNRIEDETLKQILNMTGIPAKPAAANDADTDDAGRLDSLLRDDDFARRMLDAPDID